VRRIAFFTSTRAEYGLLRPLMAEVTSRPGLALQVIASGTHLSEAHGATWHEIVADGFPIDARVEMTVTADGSEGAALAAVTVISTRASIGKPSATISCQVAPWASDRCVPDAMT